MRKGFTRRPKADEPTTPGKNYITPGGLQRLHDEHRFLLSRERPAVTAVVSWAASNGDRSENADYQYGKRRLRLVQEQTPNANPVHRLGRATTGIVLFAKTPQVASKLSANWNTSRIQKIYRALAQGIAQHDAYEILTPIGLVPHLLIGSVWAANPIGKPSKSLAKVISRTASTTTFEVSLNSGRPHQIRIHLASIGHPLVGDPLYGLAGQPLENLPGLPGDGGYFLHAQFLNFQHPITGEQINLEAALPSGFSSHQ